MSSPIDMLWLIKPTGAFEALVETERQTRRQMFDQLSAPFILDGIGFHTLPDRPGQECEWFYVLHYESEEKAESHERALAEAGFAQWFAARTVIGTSMFDGGGVFQQLGSLFPLLAPDGGSGHIKAFAPFTTNGGSGIIKAHWPHTLSGGF